MQAALVLLLSFIVAGPPPPITTSASAPAWDQVQSIMKQTGHRVTLSHYNDTYFIEMVDSDLEGAGPTIEDAAEDFLGDMNMHTEDHGADTKQPEHWKPPVKPTQPPLIKPSSKDWI